jgi:hypothetical protein
MVFAALSTVMREELYKLSGVELKEIFLHEAKAFITAFEAGATWEELKYIRERIRDLSRVIDEKVQNDPVVWS